MHVKCLAQHIPIARMKLTIYAFIGELIQIGNLVWLAEWMGSCYKVLELQTSHNNDNNNNYLLNVYCTRHDDTYVIFCLIKLHVNPLNDNHTIIIPRV